MKKILLVTFLTLFALPAKAQYFVFFDAQLHHGGGKTTGKSEDGPVNLTEDAGGNVTGTIGSRKVEIKRDSATGNETGYIGNDRVEFTYDEYGSQSGKIGDQDVLVHHEYGEHTGTVGNRAVDCRTNYANTETICK